MLWITGTDHTELEAAIILVTSQRGRENSSISMGASSSPWGYLQMDGLFQGNSQSKMDDGWVYPYFRKPPYILVSCRL